MKSLYIFILSLLVCTIHCTIYVDINNINCTNTGNGDEAAPFCNLQNALAFIDNTLEYMIQVNYGIYDEDLVLPDASQLLIQGAGDMLPRFKSIRTTDYIRNVTLNYLQFQSNHTQLHFDHVEIDYLNIVECIFMMLPSDTYTPVINISPAKNMTLRIIDTIVQSHESITEMKIIPEVMGSHVAIVNSSIWVHTVTIENVLELEVIENLIYSPFFNINKCNSNINRNIFYYGGINLGGYSLAQLFDNRFIGVYVRVLSDCIDGDICASAFIAAENIFEDKSTINFYKERNNTYSSRSLKLFHNSFSKISPEYSIINEQTNHIINATFNYWGDSTGPSICSNPGGEGSTITYKVDYGHWCLSKNCTETTKYPSLIDSTITVECNKYKSGTITSIVIFSLIFIALFIASLIVYSRFCTSVKATEEDTVKHEVKVFAMLCSIFCFLFLWFPIVAKGIGNSCQTRVPAMTCVITTTDYSLASVMILYWLFTLISNLALVYTATNYFIHRVSVYFSIFLSKLIVIGIPIILVIDILVLVDRYLSSKVMVVAIVSFALTILMEVFLLVKIYRLRKSVTTFTILVNDEEVSVQRSLLYQDGISSEQNETFVSDGIFILSYDDYKNRTQKNLIIEALTLVILFALLIWFTVYNKKVLGALSFINFIGNLLRVGYGLYVVRSTKSYSQYDLYFIVSLGFTATTSALVVVYLFLVLFEPGRNVSCYFVLAVTYIYLITSLLSMEKTSAFKRSVAAQIKQRQQDEISRESNIQGESSDRYQEQPGQTQAQNVVFEQSEEIPQDADIKLVEEHYDEIK